MKDIFEANFETEEIANFVQNSGEYYSNRFKLIQNNKRPIIWNWGAFLFAGFWFLYRKMYATGLIILAITIYSSNIIRSTWLCWAISIFCGLFANYIYLIHCDEKLTEIAKLADDEKEAEILKQGGVSLKGLIILVILLFVTAGIYVFCTGQY